MSENFLNPVLFNVLNIECVLLGGSVAYSCPGDGIDVKDWDGAVIVSSKTEIGRLVNEHRSTLCRMLSIVQEECPSMVVPGQSHPLWLRFDGVRFVGWTTDNIKKGVKILSREYFLKNTHSLNLLSFKDKRVFSSHSLGGSTAYTIMQQATRVTNDLVILHEQTVYTGRGRNCNENHLHHCAAFGVTANLLITSKCVHGNELILAYIKRQLLDQFIDVTGTTPSIASLPQSLRFDPAYARQLAEEFSSLCPKSGCSYAVPLDAYFYGPASFEDSKLEVARRQIGVASWDIADYEKSALCSAFSSNSNHGILEKPDGSKLFWKESSHQHDEIHGSILASSHFPRVQQARIARTGELIYNWFEGSTQAELRLSYLTSRMEESLRDGILFAELRKAEDTLRSWTMSLARSHTWTSQIHRFFYDRLRDRRLETFYKTGIEICDELVPFDLFFHASLVINGRTYPSLSALFAEAESILCPNQDWGFEVFGLGDQHGGNVMIGSSTLTNSSREILYIDYEVAGFHSAILDIAKPLYNDVFFNIFYADLLNHPRNISVSWEPDRLMISADVQLDSLSRGIMEIKTRYLLQPFGRAVRQNGMNLFSVENMRRLGSALMVCALLSRDFSGHWDALSANIVVGVTVSRFTAWEDLECYVLKY